VGWTEPRTWHVAERLPSGELNLHIRDNLNFLRHHHGCRLYKSANQTVGIGNNDVMSFNTEDYDTDTLHDTASNNSRIVVPAQLAGFWAMTFAAEVNADTANHNGRMILSLRKNASGAGGGGTPLESKDHSVHANLQSGLVKWQGLLAVEDHVEAFFDSQTEARDVISGVTATYLMATYLGS